ncbi:MAG: pyridoxal-dependent decarboxylase, exosortase A system-associated, partial [Chromatiales bacterium]|nr:pyridoxal-dependent decarboxylase, exosortase A system-associated [Chromatiales bacterium]
MSRAQSRLHVVLEDLETEDNELVWAGRRVSEIALEAGSTPFYCYDRERLTQRVGDLRDALPGDISIHYAMKANPMPAVVNHMVTLVDGLDVASGGELRVALDTGIDPELVSFAGPGKRPEEISQAIAAGITLNVESEIELERIIRISDEQDLRPSVALRVNPDFELKTSGMKMGGRPAQFGIDAERVPGILKRIDLDEVDFAGFHV